MSAEPRISPVDADTAEGALKEIVDDALFARVREHYDEGQIAELTMLIAWENASSRFNRALRVPSAELWKPA